MIQFRELASLSPKELNRMLKRAELNISQLLPLAEQIVERVRQDGDSAVVEFTRKFDAKDFKVDQLRVSPREFARARQELEPAVIQAVEQAHQNILHYHAEQMPAPYWFTEVQPGVMAGEKVTPIDSVGLYVPRGKGAFPSVMLMLATPARVAGVPRVVIVTPPNSDGTPDAASLLAAEICGVNELYVVGGMQAVAALALGTASIPRVSKIIGPGSSYVSAAKRLLYGVVDVGLPAGPSEAIILTDEHTDPRLACLDLLVEAEHGMESAALLVTHSRLIAEQVRDLLPRYSSELPEWRRKYVSQVLSDYGGILLTGSLEESIEFVNLYAPEHLEILTADPFVTLQKIRNAGEILLGHLTPIPIANYCLGLNAILPTGGFARSFSPVSVHDFLKKSGVGYLSQEGYHRLHGITATLADYEDFPAHAMAIRKRSEILGL